MSGHWKISRRMMMRGAGAALALPMLDVMGPVTAKAAGAKTAAPVRLACLFQPNGVFPAAWDPQGTGKDYKLSPILEPLAPVKDDVLVLSNLDNVGGSGHVGATAGFLTGVTIKNRRLGVSLDQLVAQKIGHHTALPSIELGTEPPRQGGSEGVPIAFANTVSWSSETTRVSPEINPRVAFDRMFRTGKETRRQAEDARSVIDLVLDDARRLSSKVSRADRHKIDEYLSSVRSVEKRIDAALKPVERTWTPPSKPALNRPTAGLPKDRGEHVRQMIDLLVLAFQTDTTRVGTFMMAHGFSRQNFTFIGVKGDHHSISHHKNQKHWTDDYTKVSAWYVSQLTYMLEKMKRIDEGGRSLLDNSIVLYGSGLKDGNGHKRSNLPILLAGRGGGTINPGRRIELAKGTPLPNLHLSLLHRLGIKAERFHTSTGVLSELS